ncbi:MAG: AAA family ATPase [Anaerolineae bacterium]|nr:AAA family ATPase [Anaerolineae bacterium]
MRESAIEKKDYPFSITCLRGFNELAFTSPITFFVGENGSGKSSLLEGMACAIGCTTVGSEPVKTDPTLGPARELAKHLKLEWSARTHKGFFLRAEDFFGYAKKMNQIKMEMEKELANVDQTYTGRSAFAINQAKTAYNNQLYDIQHRYGDGLDARSHGESFLTFFQARFIPDGLYLLDEPEVPLSPLRQLTLLALLREMVNENAQFIIATHSPILMAFPGASIINFDTSPIGPAKYEDLEHVNLTRDFLHNPSAFLKHL